MRRTLLFLLLCLALTPIGGFVVHAEESGGLDQRCFTEDDCQTARKGLLPTANTNEGFIRNGETLAACGDEMFGRDGKSAAAGFCLPTSHAETQIAIGGKTKFTDLGTYVAFLYKYSMIFAVTLAIIFVIVGGIQWMGSAGDAKGLQSAKKRVTNALTGLILLASSYMILTTINPALTRLRLPQVWMIRGIELADPWCRNLEGDIPLVAAREPGQTSFAPYNESAFGTSSVRPNTATCGTDYYIAGSAGQTCRGHVCEPEGTATCFLDRYGQAQPTCEQGSLVGNIYSSNLFENGTGTGVWLGRHVLGLVIQGADEGWVWEWLSSDGILEDYEDNVDLYLVCDDYTNTKFMEVNDIISNGPNVIVNENKHAQKYSILVDHNRALDKQITECAGVTRARGFLLALDLNEFGDGISDDRHFVGNDGGRGIDLGDEGAAEVYLKCMFRLPAVQEYFISGDELAEGLQLEVDVSNIVDIDDWNDESTRAYSRLGYDRVACLPSTTSSGSSSPPPVITSGGWCFTGDTPIQTEDGPVAIEHLSADAKILSFNLETKEQSYQPYRKLHSRIADGYYMVNGNLLHVTGNHPIYTRTKKGEEGWGKIDAMSDLSHDDFHANTIATLPLEVGGFVMTKDGNWIEIQTIEFVAKETTVYTIEYVDNTHTYYANDILVHNVS